MCNPSCVGVLVREVSMIEGILALVIFAAIIILIGMILGDG
jgi:hypothetical protein